MNTFIIHYIIHWGDHNKMNQSNSHSFTLSYFDTLTPKNASFCQYVILESKTTRYCISVSKSHMAWNAQSLPLKGIHKCFIPLLLMNLKMIFTSLSRTGDKFNMHLHAKHHIARICVHRPNVAIAADRPWLWKNLTTSQNTWQFAFESEEKYVKDAGFGDYFEI